MFRIRHRGNVVRVACYVIYCSGVAATLAVLGGCVVLPADYYYFISRRNINQETSSMLQSGVTTKEEVFLLLGEPDYASENGRELGYLWRKVKWIYGDMFGGSAEGGKVYLLLISFDGSDCVTTSEIMDMWGLHSTAEVILRSAATESNASAESAPREAGGE